MQKFVLSAAIAALSLGSAANAAIILENFNVDEGRFGLAPAFSGSTVGEATTPVSTADRVETDGPLEGAGHQQLVLHYSGTGSFTVRHLSGGGSAAGASGQPANTPIPVAGPGTEDGWIGFFIKTTAPGWTAQLWLEGPENNGGVPKAIIADGQWHAYEWNLDDETGGPDGWGAIAGIIGGDADVQAGNYTIDSIMLRNASTNPPPATSTIYIDFIARSDSGSIATLVPEPASLSLLALGALSTVRRRRA